MSTSVPTSIQKAWPDYRAVWRWHFYAGLFCIPFVILLSITGSIYLFKAEIESWQDRPFDHLSLNGKPKAASTQIKASLAAFPGSRFQSYELPQDESNSGRVVLQHEGKAKRIYIHPETCEILHWVPEESRLMRQIFKLHGELLLGNRGSALVELASSWAIVMILTGLFLWCPRGTNRLGGILYPRFTISSRMFWRDIHSVTGFWVSGLALFLLITGLPWAKFWGDYFKQVRRLTGTAVARQDWSNGSESKNRSAAAETSDDHASHESEKPRLKTGLSQRGNRPNAPVDLANVDRIVAALKPLSLLPPVVIAPPGARTFEGQSPEWTAKSMTANRPKRVDLVMDATTGAIKSRKDFKDRHIIDQVVGTGIAAHEGRLFGWPNQLLGILTAVGLVLVSVSSVVLWLRRRETGTLGAPAKLSSQPYMAWPMFVVVAILAVCLPLFGLSLVVVLLLERFVLKRVPGLNQWLGLASRRVNTDMP